jgi:DNA-binding YbaB/EbfC family protein
MFSQLKNIKDLRNQAKQLQSMLADESAEGAAAWGKVKVIVDGNQKITKVVIDPEMLTSSEKLADAIKEATNDALAKIQRTIAMKMQQSGMGLNF